MRKFSRDEVERLAKLSCLRVSEKEAETLADQLGSIVGYIESLGRVPVEGVEAMSHAHGTTNVFRADEPRTSLPIEELLRIVPEHAGRFIKTPLVVDSE